MMEILVGPDRFLAPIFVDLLLKIAVPIEQTDRDEVKIEIAGRFAMIARENPKPAGIIRNRFVKAKLGREIGDRFLDRADGAGFAVSIFAIEIFFELIVNIFQLAQELFVLGNFFEP